MTIPAWLANVEAEIQIAKRDRDNWLMSPEIFQFALLDWMSPHINVWLDATRVQGNVEARRLWARICRCYLSSGVLWTYLRGHENGAATRIVQTAIRLNGLRLTPDPTKP